MERGGILGKEMHFWLSGKPLKSQGCVGWADQRQQESLFRDQDRVTEEVRTGRCQSVEAKGEGGATLESNTRSGGCETGCAELAMGMVHRE